MSDEHICPKCKEEFRLVWLMGDPPEPYGDVCGCPDADLEDARAAARFSVRESLGDAHG